MFRCLRVAATPQLPLPTTSGMRGGRGWILVGAAISIIVVILSPLASTNPDGLESVANNLGFFDQGAAAPYAILPDYTLPALGDGAFSTIAAGILGILVVVTIILLIAQSKKTKNT